MYQNLIFDLDDTLVRCRKYYFECRDQFAGFQAMRYNIDPLVVDKMLNDFDVTCTKLPSGFSKERYPRSFAAISAAIDIVMGNEPNAQAAEISFNIANKVFDAPYEMIDGARDMLIKYRSIGKHIFLLTKGDEEVQRRKIALHRLDEVFPEGNIFIVPRKSVDEVRMVMKQIFMWHSNPQPNGQLDKTVMIGDSLKDDVGSALQAGIDAIHINCDLTPAWSYDDGTMIPTHCLKTVTDLPTIIPL